MVRRMGSANGLGKIVRKTGKNAPKERHLPMNHGVSHKGPYRGSEGPFSMGHTRQQQAWNLRKPRRRFKSRPRPPAW